MQQMSPGGWQASSFGEQLAPSTGVMQPPPSLPASEIVVPFPPHAMVTASAESEAMRKRMPRSSQFAGQSLMRFFGRFRTCAEPPCASKRSRPTLSNSLFAGVVIVEVRE